MTSELRETVMQKTKLIVLSSIAAWL